MAATKAKSARGGKPKPTKRTAVKKTKAVKKPKPATAAPQPAVQITPEVTPPPITPSYKELAPPPSRLKLWLAVSVSTVLIAGLWIYSLSQTVFKSDALGSSIKSTGIDDFMSSISSDWNELQNSTSNLNSNLNTNTNTTPSTTSGNNLDNLFSDL